MKILLTLIALLLFGCGQETTSKDREKSDSLIESKYQKYIGTYPSDFLNDRNNWSLISPSMDGLQLQKIVSEYFGVVTPIKKEGKFIIGTGCKSHACDLKEAIFYVDTQSDYFILFVNDAESSLLTHYSNKISELKKVKTGYGFDQPMPNEAKKWLSERGIKIDGAGQTHSTPDSSTNHIQGLIANERQLNDKCGGGSGNDSKTMDACNKRDALNKKLNQLGWCYGKRNEAGYQMKWHQCQGDSLRN